MDICCLENSEFEPKFQKKKKSVVLRGDIIFNDDSGSYVLFTEQGSSASQTTAAELTDVLSSPPGCAGQAADAVSTCTHLGQNGRCSHLCSKIPKSECPGIWIRLPEKQMVNSWSSIEDPVFLLERNLLGHPWRDYCGEMQFENVLRNCLWIVFTFFFVSFSKRITKQRRWKEVNTLQW